MSTMRVGVIGCGYWGPNLIRNFVELPQSNLVAIADLQEERLQHVKTRYPQIQYAFTDYTKLYELDLDAVVVATPPHTHFKIAKDCLEHDLHVLVEKPITLKSEDAYALWELAKERSLVLMVGHTFEYNPAVHTLKQMIDSGELGSIHYVDAVRASLGLFQTQANVVWDLAPHDISILRFLLGTDPISVSARGSACVQNGIEDVAYVALTFPGNVLAHIRLSWLDPLKTRRITVVGSKKMVVYDDVEPLEKIKIYDKGVTAIRHTDTYGEFQFAYHYGDVVTPYIRFEEPLKLQCTHFLDCVREGTAPRSDGYSGMRVVEIVEAAQKSLQDTGSLISTRNGHAPEYYELVNGVPSR